MSDDAATRDLIRAITAWRKEQNQLIEGWRNQQSVQNDEILSILKANRESLIWLINQWKKFARNEK